MASDGIWDNLFDDDIKICLKASTSSDHIVNVDQASQCISTLAECKGYMTDYESPFYVEAEAEGLNHLGGKPDDIAVVVS